LASFLAGLGRLVKAWHAAQTGFAREIPAAHGVQVTPANKPWR
jgi:hypothetical protein